MGNPTFYAYITTTNVACSSLISIIARTWTWIVTGWNGADLVGGLLAVPENIVLLHIHPYLIPGRDEEG